MKLWIALVGLVMGAGSAVWGAAGALPVPATGVYLGAWANPASASSQERAMELLEGPAPGGINRTFALHLIYYQWGDLAALLDSNGVLQPDGALAGDIAHGRVPVISWKCDQTGTNSNHLIAGANPAEDELITASARALAQYPGPVLLRWFWEFNLLSSGNSAGNQACLGNAGTAPTAQVYADYIAAWQHIWRLFQAAGATNVSFVWNPGHYNADGDAADPHGYYPGNGYVDWIATDSYQRAAGSAFTDDFGLFYGDFSQAQYGGKPLMVGENAAANSATYGVETQAPYLQGLLTDLQSNQYPLLKAYDYFDSDGTATKGNNWLLDASGLTEFATVGGNAAFNPAPSLTVGSLANGATYVAGGLVPGSWAQVKGSQLGYVTRVWNAGDFTGLGSRLPTTLSGISVTVNTVAAAIYYVDIGQVSFQVPDGITGSAIVQVIRNGVASNIVMAAAARIAPGIFPVVENGTSYAAGVFGDGKFLGNPAVSSAFRQAKPGDVVQLYATGLTVSPAGVLPVSQGVPGVMVNIGNVSVAADFAGLVAVGEFQINFTVPAAFANQAAGNYPISIQAGGVTSPALVIPVAPR